MFNLFKGVILLGLLLPLMTKAQKSVTYFSDDLQKTSHSEVLCVQRQGQFTYVASRSQDSGNFASCPTIVKLDTAGNSLWTCSLNKQIDTADNRQSSFYAYGYIQTLAIDDTSLYAGYTGGNGINQIWKVNQLTGDAVWKKTSGGGPLTLKVADSKRIAYTYNAVEGYVYELVDKFTGKSLFSKVISSSVRNKSECFFNVDNDGSTYIIKGDSIFKYTTPELTILSWAKQVSTLGAITEVKIENDGIYFFGAGRNLFAGAVSNTDGTVKWQTSALYNPNVLEDYVSDYKVVNGYVYMSGLHMYYGGTTTAYRICKIDRNTGALVWETVYIPSELTYPKGYPNYFGVTTFDVDQIGNVYTSGYENGNDMRAGVWGICKFDSAGKLVYHKTVPDTMSYVAYNSKGVSTFVYNNRVFHIGQLQRSQSITRPDVTCIATDTSSVFAPSRVTGTYSAYQEFSNVAGIHNFSVNKYAVLKQMGPACVVELRSSEDGKILWSKKIMHQQQLTADKLNVTADNQIIFSALSHGPGNSMQFDYQGVPDSIYFIKLDSTGIVTEEKPFSLIGKRGFKSIQLYTSSDNNTAFYYTQIDRYNNPFSLSASNISNATKLGEDYMASNYLPLEAKQNIAVAPAGDSAVYFRTSPPISAGNTALLEILTNGLTTSAFKITDLQFSTYNLAVCDSNSVIVLGRDTSMKSNIVRFSVKSRSRMWTSIADPAHIIDMADCSGQHVYLSGRKGAGLLIRQLDKNTGSTKWEKIIAPAGANQYYVPLNQKFNTQRSQYTIVGYIADSSAIQTTQSAFYVTVDVNGSIVNQWTEKSDFNRNNALSQIEVSQLGQTLIGGAQYKMPYGRSGIFIEADSAFKVPHLPLTVNISIVPKDTVCAGDSIQLIANASGCTGCTYLWNGKSSAQGNTLIVKESGEYTVTISNGVDSAQDSTTVVVNPLPQKPQITQSNDSLVSSSASGNQWYLNGQTIPGATAQSYKATTSGVYKVQIVKDGCLNMSDSIVYKDSTNEPIAVQISTYPSDSVCLGESVKLIATASGCTGCTYSWSGKSSAKGDTMVVKESGMYTVKISNGADSAQDSITVVVKPLPLKPQIAQSNDSLVSSSASGNQWYLNGQIIPGATAQLFKATTSGTYTVQVAKDGCKNISDTIVYKSSVNDHLTAQILAYPSDSVCLGESVRLVVATTGCNGCTFSWTDHPEINDSNLVVKASGTYTVMVKNNSDSILVSHAVTIKPLPAKPTIIQNSDTLKSSVGNGNQWYWNGQKINGATSQSYTAIRNGVYSVQVTKDGCKNMSDTIVHQLASGHAFAVSISSFPAETACDGDSLLLVANAPDCSNCTYTWSTSPIKKGPMLTVKKEGTYTVSASNNIDSVTASQVIVMKAVPPIPVVADAGLVLRSSASQGNQWYLNGQIIPGATTPVLKPSSSGSYTVRVENDGCKNQSTPLLYTMPVNPNDTASFVFYPNPAKNIYNVLNRNKKTVRISVYNMNGKKYFETVSDNALIQVNITNLASGTYYVVVKEEKTDKKIQTKFLKI